MADERQLLTDLKLVLRHHELRPVYSVQTERKRIVTRQGVSWVDDITTVSGTDNLAQAIMMRLLAPRGELAALGHPEYGSRLFELIGQTNTETTRNLVKLTILESVQQEPRVAKVVTLTVDPDKVDRQRVNVLLQVQPVGPSPVVTIGPFVLEFEQ